MEKLVEIIKKRQLIKANIKHGSIRIESSEDATILWNNGYFGNSQLSMEEQKMEEKIGFASRNSLSLSNEETFFLSFNLCVLEVFENDSELPIETLWKRLFSLDPEFPLQYIVYQHFRCIKWVVRSGLKFGCEWSLYAGGPPFFHSQYLVWVQCSWQDNMETDQTFFSRMDNDEDIVGLDRLAHNLKKEVLLCQVLRPRTMTNDCLMDISCIKKFIITEISMKRWIPNSDHKDDY